MNSHLNRTRNICDFAVSSLLRRKVKNMSLLALYTLIIFVVASLLFFVQALRREAELVLKDAPDIAVQRSVAGRHDLMPIEYAKQIAAIPGVRGVTLRRWGYYFDPATGANYTLVVSEHDSPPPGTIWIGSGVARNIGGAQAGSLMPIQTSKGASVLLEVRKVFPAESELVAADLIVLAPEDFQAVFNLPGGFATDLAVSVANPGEIATIAGKIAHGIPGTRPITKSEMLRTYDELFDWRGGLLVAVLSTSLLAFIIFAWDRAAGLSAEERREIGILKSIGWETSDVLMLKFWEGAIISLTAFMFGVILAYCHVFFFSATLFEHALKGWAVLYPRFRLAPYLDPYQLSVLFFLTVLPYTVATIVPAWLAATIDPDEAMRL